MNESEFAYWRSLKCRKFEYVSCASRLRSGKVHSPPCEVCVASCEDAVEVCRSWDNLRQQQVINARFFALLTRNLRENAFGGSLELLKSCEEQVKAWFTPVQWTRGALNRVFRSRAPLSCWPNCSWPV
ncbi:hypothetical protein TcasGA2_TC014010 [Tribolium castaneum]|uniref:Uncharacterized protein n=1 Tax=Tribolium castaneum TaxID=7070 RepID=D6WJF0_TRICA|nr:hypothetical protein TcasGA2_TC014010 [Tribolium castaneum]